MMQVDEEGKLNFEVFTVHAEYFLLDDDRKYQFLLMIKEWMESEMDKI